MKSSEIINKTMDRDDLASPDASAIVAELNALIKELRSRSLRISSWFGQFDLSGDPLSSERINRGYGYQPLDDAVDDINFPWFLYWEIAWVVMNTPFRPGDSVLDLGGCSSLFGYYLASKGLRVCCVDKKKELVKNADHVAAETGWHLKNYAMDMREMSFDTQFNHITSICVFEHIPLHDRIRINETIRSLLVEGGNFSITFDYRNPSKTVSINSPQDVYEQFVEPSRLAMRGNQVFHDNGKSYLVHPFHHKDASWAQRIQRIRRGQFSWWDLFSRKSENEYTFGACFLQKTG